MFDQEIILTQALHKERNVKHDVSSNPGFKWPRVVAVAVLGFYLTNGQSANEDQFTECVNRLVQQAQEDGISEKTIITLLREKSWDDAVILADRHQPEKILSLDEYLARFLTATRIQRAKSLLKRHRTQLSQLPLGHSVEPELLIALWAVETNFGDYLGYYDTGRALTTLACDKRRSDFFTTELFALLRLVDAGRLNTEDLRGSWAGAVGHLQFLPTVIDEHGTDLNQNTQIDVFDISTDLFATASHFLRASGWQPGHPWGVEVTESETAQSNSPMNSQLQAGASKLISPDGPDGRMFRVYENFEALLIWNRSHKYALTVAILLDILKAESRP